jgi:transcriptional regulator with XRE-family HTH domain
MQELGEMLRKARQEKGLTLADVEEATRIRQRYLEALEYGDEHSLPARVYVEGFVRSYAAFLGLSAPDMLARYRAARPPATTETPPLQPALRPVHLPGRFPWGRLILAGIVLAALVLAAAAYVRANLPLPVGLPGVGIPLPAPTSISVPSGQPTATPEPVTPEPTPTRLPTPTATPTPIPEVRVQVRITERAWLRVTVDGSVVFEGELSAGDSRTWIGRDTVAILSGNAGGTDVTVDGAPRGPLGAPGQVVEIAWTRP